MQTLTLAPLGREHLSAVYDGIMPAFGHLVAVPRAVPELCSGRVLTMEKLEGPKLEEEAKRQLLAVGVDVEQGSVTDFLKRGAKMAVAQDGSSGATESGGSTTPSASRSICSSRANAGGAIIDTRAPPLPTSTPRRGVAVRACAVLQQSATHSRRAISTRKRLERSAVQVCKPYFALSPALSHRTAKTKAKVSALRASGVRH